MGSLKKLFIYLYKDFKKNKLIVNSTSFKNLNIIKLNLNGKKAKKNDNVLFY